MSESESSGSSESNSEENKVNKDEQEERAAEESNFEDEYSGKDIDETEISILTLTLEEAIKHLNINESTVQEYKSLFDIFDCDLDGEIDMDDLRQALAPFYEDYGIHWKDMAPTKRELFRMITKCDINNSGSLDFAQFLLLFEEKFNRNQEHKFLEIFDLMDIDSDGFISHKDLIRLCKLINYRKIVGDEMITEMDTSKDGKITFEG